MLTFEEICEIMGTNPSEIIECEDGMVMCFGADKSVEIDRVEEIEEDGNDF